MLHKIMLDVVAIEISSPTAKPKLAKKELQKILKDYDFDDDFIEDINEDTLKGFDAAISVFKYIINKRWEEINE